MAVVAAASAVSVVTRTSFLPSLKLINYNQHQPILLHPHSSRSFHHLSLITIPQPKRLNVSSGEDEFEAFDERFIYNDDLIDGDEESDEEDDDDTESSVDLLFRFIQSMFRKVSKRVRKASRSVLPAVIPPQLVSFGIDGVLLLASVSILKAFLEVVCTIGGTVFVVILLLRVIWAAISYFQSIPNDFNRNGSSYNRTQPVS